MDFKTKLLVFFLIGVLFPVRSMGQTIISYTYDSAGNRIGRTMIARSLTDSEDLQMSEEASTAVSDGADPFSDQFQRASLDVRIIDIIQDYIHYIPSPERPQKIIEQRVGFIIVPSDKEDKFQGIDQNTRG